MSLDRKNISEINEKDLLGLIESSKREGKDIDYKLKLISNSDGDKKEFLYDVSSFANASGGHLVVGMAERDGIPVELLGLKLEDIDAEILRLDNIIRDGIEPRISGLQIHPVNLMSGSVAIVIRIPRSWAIPHMVSYQGATKFYSRNSAGKYLLDISEIRSLFSLSESVNERIKRFRTERVSQIIAGDTPLPLPETPKIVLHLLPLSSFDVSANYDLVTIDKHVSKLCPLNSSGWDHRFNFDGFLTYSTLVANIVRSYVQVRRNGIVEAVELSMLKARGDEKYIPSTLFEREIIDGVDRFLRFQKDVFGIDSPVVIQLSLINVKGYIMADSLNRFKPYPIDKDVLFLPDTLIENYDQAISRLMKPIFDALWNATGWSGSIYYDQDGNWNG